MKNLNSNKWREYKLTDIFTPCNTKCILQRDIESGSGTTPYVTAQRGNNGVMTLIDCPDSWLEKGNCIMIGGKTLSMSYQEEPFCSNDSHNICLYLKNENHAEKDVFLFLVTAIRSSLKSKYKWSDSISMKRILKETVMLPSSATGEPDFEYMIRLMKHANNKASLLLSENQRRLSKDKSLLDKNWKAFCVGDIFPNIIKPTVLHTRQVVEDNSGIPYVVRSKYNNGIKYRVRLIKGLRPSPSKVITFGAENAAFFYQKEPFYSGRDIYYIDTQELSENVALFVTSCLNVIAKNYSYNYGMFPDLVRNETIKLPYNNKGLPDWDYMERYMSASLNKARKRINAYNAL